MTTSAGTGGPKPGPEVPHTGVHARSASPGPDPAAQPAVPESPPAARQSGAYEVAAALRAQATKAAQRVHGAFAPATDDNGRAPSRGDERGATTPAAGSNDPAAVAGASAASAGASAATPAQPYATGPGPATSVSPAARPPVTAVSGPPPLATGTRPTASTRSSGAAAPAPAVRRPGRVRKARLRLLRLDPWSVMKTAFLLSVALGIMLFVAVAVLWSVLDAAGVFTAVGDVVRDVTASETSPGIDIEQFVGMSRVLGFTTLVAVIDVVLVTALATLGAFLYNLSASLLGGLEVTLAEDD